MARPKTDAANYVTLTFRMPPAMLDEVRAVIGDSGIPLNTQLLHLVRAALRMQKQSSQEPKNPKAPALVGSAS